MENHPTYTIVANGDCVEKDTLVNKVTLSGKTIALDGAANYLREIGLKPDFLIGDMDSLSKEDKESFERSGAKILFEPDQNLTDLEKAIIFCDNRSAKNIEILNALGGRNDHSLANVSFLKKYYSDKRKITLFGKEDKLEFVKNKKIKAKGKPGSRIAFLGFFEAQISSFGLKYEMRNFKIKLGYKESVCNSLDSNEAIVEIDGEAIMISSLEIKTMHF